MRQLLELWNKWPRIDTSGEGATQCGNYGILLSTFFFTFILDNFVKSLSFTYKSRVYFANWFHKKVFCLVSEFLFFHTVCRNESLKIFRELQNIYFLFFETTFSWLSVPKINGTPCTSSMAFLNGGSWC